MTVTSILLTLPRAWRLQPDRLNCKLEFGLLAYTPSTRFGGILIQRASPACSASFRPSQRGPAPDVFFSPDFGEFFKFAPRAVTTYYHHARKSVRSKPLSIVTWRHSIHIWLFMIRCAACSRYANSSFIESVLSAWSLPTLYIWRYPFIY